jgi:ABC-type transport system involved in cytochrome c biogenesis permease component
MIGIVIVGCILAVCSRSNQKEKIFAVIILSLPIWFPFLYVAASVVEKNITSEGILDSLGFYVLFTLPAVGAIPLITKTSRGVVG